MLCVFGDLLHEFAFLGFYCQQAIDRAALEDDATAIGELPLLLSIDAPDAHSDERRSIPKSFVKFVQFGLEPFTAIEQARTAELNGDVMFNEFDVFGTTKLFAVEKALIELAFNLYKAMPLDSVLPDTLKITSTVDDGAGVINILASAEYVSPTGPNDSATRLAETPLTVIEEMRRLPLLENRNPQITKNSSLLKSPTDILDHVDGVDEAEPSTCRVVIKSSCGSKLPPAFVAAANIRSFSQTQSHRY